MPCLDISTNVILDGVDLDSIFSEATKTVAAIIGKPENVRTIISTRGRSDDLSKIVCLFKLTY